MKAADRTRLLDVQRFPRGGVSTGIDQENAPCMVARRERMSTGGPNVTGAEDRNGCHVTVLYSTGSMGTLSGKTAIVTGGSRGIGLAIARALVGGGANVMITGTREKPLAEAARELGATAMAERANVRDYKDVERAFDAAAAQFGGIDILVNNAGVGVFTPVASMSVEQWHDVIDTNLTGVFYCCRAVLPHLRKRGGGWIISISSLAGKNAFPEAAAYCASKSGLNAFCEALMQEVRHDGIRVAYVMPGSVNTNFGGHQTAGADWKLSPDDVAEVVVDLLAHPSRSLPSRVEIRPARPPKKG